MIVLTSGRFGEAVEGAPPAEEAAAEVSVSPPFGKSDIEGKSRALKFDVEDRREMLSKPAEVAEDAYRGGLCF